MSCLGHAEDGESHQPKGEQYDADQVIRKLAPRREPRRVVEERREHGQEHKIRIQRDPRNARNKADEQSADDEHDGIGRLELFSYPAKEDDKEQKKQEHDLHRVNAARLHGVAILIAISFVGKLCTRMNRDFTAPPLSRNSSGKLLSAGDVPQIHDCIGAPRTPCLGASVEFARVLQS